MKQEYFRDLHVCKHVLMYNAHVKRLHSVKWRGLYGGTATMQEPLLKRVQVLHGGKEVWNETVTESCMRQDCSTHWCFRSTAQKSVEKKTRHMTSSNSQSNHRHLRRKCHWMTLTRVLFGGSSPACTP